MNPQSMNSQNFDESSERISFISTHEVFPGGFLIVDRHGLRYREVNGAKIDTFHLTEIATSLGPLSLSITIDKREGFPVFNMSIDKKASTEVIK